MACKSSLTPACVRRPTRYAPLWGVRQYKPEDERPDIPSFDEQASVHRQAASIQAMILTALMLPALINVLHAPTEVGGVEPTSPHCCVTQIISFVPICSPCSQHGHVASFCCVATAFCVAHAYRCSQWVSCSRQARSATGGFPTRRAGVGPCLCHRSQSIGQHNHYKCLYCSPFAQVCPSPHLNPVDEACWI